MTKLSKNTETPNFLKPSLGVALPFRIRKIVNYNKDYCGFENNFFRISRCTKNYYYFYGFFDFTTQSYRQLHKGIKLPINGLQITIWAIIFNLLYIPFVIITAIPYFYFDGCVNFIRNKAWCDNVRFFTWINFASVIILLIVIFFKSYA